MKNLSFLLFAGIFSLATLAQGQDYNKAIGLRLGYPASVSYKTFLSNPAAIELYAGARWFVGYRYVALGAMYLHHIDIEGVDGLKWYVGGGVQGLLYGYNRTFNGINTSRFGVGANGAVGLDFAVPDLPLNVSLDWLPTIYLNGFLSGFGGGFGAVGIRYILD